jgi:hypothetical protein
MLSKDQIAQFRKQGYLVIDTGVPESLLDDIVDQTSPAYERGGSSNGAYAHGTRVADAWKWNENVRRLAVLPVFLGALQDLFGRRPLPFQTLNFPIGTQQRPHSDTVHFNSIPSGYMAGIWMALEDIDDDNGPLVYYPGSHKLREYSMRDAGLEPGYDHYHAYEEFILEKIREHGLEPVHGTVSKGQAIIWHANLLHGGSLHKDPARSRHSQVTHYFFSGCRYYTPMDSTPHQTKYRHPIWIPNRPLNRAYWTRARFAAFTTRQYVKSVLNRSRG